jgi:hypothetical protein
MRLVLRSSLALLALAVLARAAGFLAYAFSDLAIPGEVGDLESKLVHLAWRVQEGARLYPPWQDYPHVTNFFAPGYFLVVGLLGALTGAGLDRLFVIGREVTLSCGLATALVLGWVVRRSDGAGAGLVGAGASLGAAPMFGAGLMVRPDTMAELLGTAGFFLAVGRTGRGRWAGTVLLSLAILTKQTALAFLVAAVAALFVSGRVHPGAKVLGACVLAVGAVIAGVSAFLEPLFASSLLGESRTPWELANWTEQVLRLAAEAPDLFVLPALALPCWLTSRPRRLEPAILWAALLGAGLLTVGKLGSGLNYFLSLRLVEALAVGALWGAATEPRPRHAGLVVAAILAATAALVPGTFLAAQQARRAYAEASFFRSLAGAQFLLAQRRLLRVAEDPQVRLLTDSGLLQLYQRDRAPFVDPFQFRHLVNSGQIQPTVISHGLDGESYDFVITTTDLNGPGYETYLAGLPAVLARSARAHYVPLGRPMGLYLYGRRGARGGGPFR